MKTLKTIRKRSEDIGKRLSNMSGERADSMYIREIEERIEQVALLSSAFPGCQESDGLECSPMECSPFLTAKILFHLDRCEEIIIGLDKSGFGMNREKAEPEELLYPSIGEAIWGRIFAFLVYIRARVGQYEADCQCPTVREILYLKSPFWLAPLVRILLPRKRPRRSYYPHTDALDS